MNSFDDQDDYPKGSSILLDDGEGSISMESSDRGVQYESSVSQSYLSPSQTSGRTGGGRGGGAFSGEYTRSTSYNSGSDGNSASYNDSFTYDDDTSLRSPRSASEMSSTFASFFNENEYILQARETLDFLRRPVSYFLFAAVHSTAVGSICRLAQTFSRVVTTKNLEGSQPPTVEAIASLCRAAPSGYPDVPGWLKEVRASLPAVLEQPAAWALRAYGIPILSELQQSSTAAVVSVSRQAADTLASWTASGPAIPVALFLPLFSLAAVQVARSVLAKQHHTEFLYGDEKADIDDDGVSARNLSVKASSQPLSVLESPIRPASERTVGSGMVDAIFPLVVSPVVPPVNMAAVSHPVAADSVSPSSPGQWSQLQFYLQQQGQQGTAAPSGEWGVEGQQGSASSKSHAQTPLTHRHATQVESGEIVAAVEPTASRPKFDSAVKPDSPPPRLPLDVPAGSRQPPIGESSRQDRALRGNVVAALIGSPSVTDVNVVLLAAARYGCSAVLLPAAVQVASGIAEVPPSLTLWYTNDVLHTCSEMREERGLGIIRVLSQSAHDGDVELIGYRHPMNAIYVFAPSADTTALTQAALASLRGLADAKVYVGVSSPDVPVNQCLFDRLRKEREEGGGAGA